MKKRISNFLSILFIYFICEIISSSACLSKMLSDETEAGAHFARETQIPIGLMGDQIEYANLPQGTPHIDVPQIIAAQREVRGLPREIPLSQKENLFQQALWKRAKAEDLNAILPGRITKIFIKEGQDVKRGDKLYEVDCMKNNIVIPAFYDGTIDRICFALEEKVDIGSRILSFIPKSHGWEGISQAEIAQNESILLSLFPWALPIHVGTLPDEISEGLAYHKVIAVLGDGIQSPEQTHQPLQAIPSFIAPRKMNKLQPLKGVVKKAKGGGSAVSELLGFVRNEEYHKAQQALKPTSSSQIKREDSFDSVMPMIQNKVLTSQRLEDLSISLDSSLQTLLKGALAVGLLLIFLKIGMMLRPINKIQTHQKLKIVTAQKMNHFNGISMEGNRNYPLHPVTRRLMYRR
jgi:biotin carboxyl carrier protein